MEADLTDLSSIDRSSSSVISRSSGYGTPRDADPSSALFSITRRTSTISFTLTVTPQWWLQDSFTLPQDSAGTTEDRLLRMPLFRTDEPFQLSMALPPSSPEGSDLTKITWNASCLSPTCPGTSFSTRSGISSC